MSGKKLAIIGLLAVLVLGGSAFGIHTWKMNAVAFRGISLPMKGVEAEQRDRWVETFEEIAAEEVVLQKIVEVSDYQNLMGLDGEQAAVADLTKRMKIKYRPRKNSIEIGLTGIRKEIEELKLIAPKIYQVCAMVLAGNDREFAAFSSQKRE
ncbi:hypothetical protein OAE47_00325 [Akkermansiaceae bacterium]|nr:hypothetical protein [Akkermansiaceae bacterium]MDB4726843.1 hypothetical protein [bacterium]